MCSQEARKWKTEKTMKREKIKIRAEISETEKRVEKYNQVKGQGEFRGLGCWLWRPQVCRESTHKVITSLREHIFHWRAVQTMLWNCITFNSVLKFKFLVFTRQSCVYASDSAELEEQLCLSTDLSFVGSQHCVAPCRFQAWGMGHLQFSSWS